jgi:hypothetical protein
LDVAARYPHPSLRQFGDIDVLVPDPVLVQRALLEAGWRTKLTPGFHVEPERNGSVHQLAPIVYEGTSLPLEVHRRPNWPTWAQPPSTDELFAASKPSTVDIEGVCALEPQHHAPVVLAHAWSRQPFERFSQLIDVALLIAESDHLALVRLAKRWRLDRLLGIAERAVDAYLLDRGPHPVLLRCVAPQLENLGSPSIGRAQLNRYVASLAVSPFTSAARAAGSGALRRLQTLRDA